MDVYVRPGDSFWYYSQLFHIPLQLILNSNRNVNPQILSVGTRIQIPGFMSVPYQIQPGDSSGKLAPSKSIAKSEF